MARRRGDTNEMITRKHTDMRRPILNRRRCAQACFKSNDGFIGASIDGRHVGVVDGGSGDRAMATAARFLMVSHVALVELWRSNASFWLLALISKATTNYDQKAFECAS